MRKHAYLYRVQREGPRGGREIRWRAFGDDGATIAEERTRQDTEQRLQNKGYTHVTRIEGTARPSEMAAHQGDLAMRAERPREGLNK